MINCQNGWVRIKKAKLKWLGFTNKPKDRVHKEKHALIKIKYCMGLHSVGRETELTHSPAAEVHPETIGLPFA